MRFFITLLSVLLVSGCSTFSNEYSCGAIPEATCTPVSDVYEGSSGNVYDYRKNLNKGGKESAKIPVIKVGTTHRAINHMNPGDPILTQPVVMRVLFRSFETGQKDLDAGGYTYLRMRGSKWVMQN
jgi:hypothetical protein